VPTSRGSNSSRLGKRGELSVALLGKTGKPPASRHRRLPVLPRTPATWGFRVGQATQAVAIPTAQPMSQSSGQGLSRGVRPEAHATTSRLGLNRGFGRGRQLQHDRLLARRQSRQLNEGPSGNSRASWCVTLSSRWVCRKTRSGARPASPRPRLYGGLSRRAGNANCTWQSAAPLPASTPPPATPPTAAYQPQN
jgi:hypothetical protein